MFRPATSADTEALLGLMRGYYTDEGYPFAEAGARKALVELLAVPTLGRVWIAHEAGAPIAYAVLTLGFSLEYAGRDAFLDDVYVAPRYRGRGLGRAALEAVEATCMELEVRALHLVVERYKTRAQALYRRAGFVDHDRYLMTKRFDGGQD
jgi:ribosomal protein S18 acetylase RimI-like enzyme